jgi:ABC-type Fe3+ transport system substrate-binding protein
MSAFMTRYITGFLFFVIAGLPYLAMLWSGRTVSDLPPQDAETLFIMSPHRREVRLEYGRGFDKWMKEKHGRRARIQWLDAGGTAKILKDIESRFATSPNAPGVDLMFGGGVAPYLTASEQGWLEQVDIPPEALQAIPDTCAGAPTYDANRRWFGVALSGFGILYNRPLVERLRLPVPEDWQALGKPEYYSWVGSGDPRSSGSVHMCYEIILQAYGFEKGWDLITRICANVRGFGEAGGTVPREVGVGEIAAGMVIDQYAQTVVNSIGSDWLVFVLPRQTTVIGPDAIGVIRGTKSPELSRLFVEYVLSVEGQRILFQPAGVNGQKFSLYRMPVVAELYKDPHAPQNNPYDYPAGLKYDDTKGSQRWNAVNDLMGVWLIDAHADLRRAWKRVIELGCPSDLMAQLCAAPVTEDELKALGAAWKDPRRKQEITQQWSKSAKERYARLAEAGR